MPAAPEKQILKLDVWQRAPAAITLSRWQFGQHFLHLRDGRQKDGLRLLADIRCWISRTASLRVLLGRLFQLVADADKIHHESARLVAENPVYARDGLHERVALHRLV